LHRLTGLEQDKLLGDYKEVLKKIAELTAILATPERLMEVIREELVQVRDEFSDARRTEIIASRLDLSNEDLITEEDVVVTISHGGYAKTQPLADYQAQRRGGVGKTATAVKDEDYIVHLLVVSTHQTILCFTSAGKVYWLKAYEIPQASRNARGRPMINILPLGEGERVTTILPVSEYTEGHFVFMATGNGTVKKTALTEFSRQRSTGLRAVELDEGDTLVGTAITSGKDDILLVASSGKAARFSEDDVRAMGRTARGVRGIKLGKDQQVISLIIPTENGYVLTVSENGFGKRSRVDEFPVHGRGGQGVIAMQTSERNGSLVGAVQVFDADEMMLISDQGMLVRTRVDEVSVLGRNTQGVTLIKLKTDELLVGVERVEEPDVEEQAIPEPLSE
jgi:DNA gyrase subunit A